MSRALERDDAFAAVWPGRLARRDFKPVEGSEVVSKNVANIAPANENTPASERASAPVETPVEPPTLVSTGVSTALDADGAEEMSEEALAARIKAALKERRMEALRLATEVEGDTRTSSSGLSWQRTAALGRGRRREREADERYGKRMVFRRGGRGGRGGGGGGDGRGASWPRRRNRR